MITFACKTIKVEDLVRCSFNLNKTSYTVLMYMLKNNDRSISVQDLSVEMNLERTTVQKAMKVLLDASLVKRLQVNMDTGGYQYIYTVLDKDNIKKNIVEIVNNWSEKVKTEINSW